MFRTELSLTPASEQLPLSARVLTIGSCFSETIGNRLAAAKVPTLVNPFGTVFNPISACKLLRAAAGEEADWQQHLVEARGRWQSYDLHASIGSDSPVALLETIQQLLRDTGKYLAAAEVVVLTLGSAWAYRLKETEELVSNCHKMAAAKFDKELLTPDEIINAVAETHAYLRQRNPRLRFVLTVSPVRHLKDTLPLNAVSKSVLRVACHYLSELLPDVSYFPAYELLLDDLRDYRFYAADMLHPSPVAEDYIWERFARTYFDAEFGRFRKEWEAVRQALHHRPLHPAAPEHRQFLTTTLERLEKLAGQADMQLEILEIRQQLGKLPTPVTQPVPEAEDENEQDRHEEVAAGTDLVVEVSATPKQPESAKALPVAPSTTVAEAVPELAVSREAETAAALEEAARSKKKRRSRGGAKRNKKKHAAQLAEGAVPATPDTETPLVAQAEPLPAQELNAPSVRTLDFDPEAPLQTNLERRRRASRRGRQAQPEAEPDKMGGTFPEDQLALAADGNIGQMPATIASETALPIDSLPAALPPTEPENAAASAELQASPRAGRTGRSASEMRAAALRKPRRPDSRIKTLYATPSETPTAPGATPAPLITPATASEAATTDVRAGASASALAPVASIVPAIPMVRGTGASGRLSAMGKATLNAGSAQPKAAFTETRSKTATASSSTSSPPPEAAPVDIPSAAAPPTNDETAVTPSASASVTAASATAGAAKRRRKPAGPVPGKKANSTKQPAAVSASAVEPAAKRGAKEPAAAKAAVPAARRPKAPPTPPDTIPPEPKPTAPKRAPRSPRRKPAAANDKPEAS